MQALCSFNLKRVFVMDIYEKLLKCASVLVMLCSIFSAAARNFIHPGLLHSQDDLKRITCLLYTSDAADE